MKSLGVVLASVAFVVSLAASAQSPDRAVLDYQNRPFRDAQPMVSATDKARVTAGLTRVMSNDAVKALGTEYVVLGQARGTFDKKSDVDFFLVSLKPPIAAEPFPKTAAQVILAIKGQDVVATNVIAAERQYARLVGSVDLDGDGGSEMLLEGRAYNMGQLVLAVDAVKLEADGKTRVAQSVAAVYSDSCETSVGAKTRTSKSIGLRGGKLVETVHPEKCG
jgi:hypothetical protein